MSVAMSKSVIRAPTMVVCAAQKSNARSSRAVAPAGFAGRSISLQSTRSSMAVFADDVDSDSEIFAAVKDINIAEAIKEEMAEEDRPAYEPKFKLKFIWLEKNVAVAVDQIYSKGEAPLTEYFFWPRKDAWEELKTALDATPWISERDVVLMLNKTTEVINYWQEEGSKHTLLEARDQFPDCEFIGS